MVVNRLSPYKKIVLVYIGIILIGALILATPLSSSNGQWSNPMDCIFTATSAMAVTGLVVVNTAQYWSTFGQVVILLLIQVGGMGIMTIVSLLHLFVSKKLSQRETTVVMQSAGAITRKDVKNIMMRVLTVTLVIEALGALILAIRFSQDYAIGQSIYYGLFHAVSAFCNAGFDIIGSTEISSLMQYSTDITVNVTVMLLITFGGTGFIVWNDIIKYGWNIKKYKLHSRIILLANAILVVGGAILFALFEYNNAHTMGGGTFGELVLQSFFQSVTCRTAGFNTVAMESLTEPSKGLSMLLMMIGGGAGSTAGGIKITTAVVLIASMISIFASKKDVTVFNKRIDETSIKQAMVIFFMWIALTTTSAIAISAIEGVDFTTALFECYSALGTVGLSLGITSNIGLVSKIILTLLMYVGRVGIITIITALIFRKREDNIRRPVENILIG